MDNTKDKDEIRKINVDGYTIEIYEPDYIKRIKGLYGFIYVTTNLINGKKYVGQKKIDKKGNWKYYLGSGVLFKEALEKYGRENFHREIIDIAFSKGELNYWERYYTILFNSVSDSNWYNLCYGGGTYTLTEEQRKEASERMKGEGNPMYGRKHTEEELENLRQRFSGKGNPMYGRRGEDAPGHRKNRKDLVKMNQYTLENVFIKTFPSITDAAESVDRSVANIQACAKGKTNHCAGFKWYYADDYDQPDKSKIIIDQRKANNATNNKEIQIYKFVDVRTKEITCGIIIDYINKEYTYYPNGSKILYDGRTISKKRIYELLNEVKLLGFSGSECEEKINMAFSLGYCINIYGKRKNVFIILNENDSKPTLEECNILKRIVEDAIDKYDRNFKDNTLTKIIYKAISDYDLNCIKFGYKVIAK